MAITFKNQAIWYNNFFNGQDYIFFCCMNIPVKNISDALTGRLARNIYFWLFLLWLRANEARSWEHLLLILPPWLLLMAMFCLNNFLLVPTLLYKRRISAYFASVIPVVALTAILYTITLKLELRHFAGYVVNDLSFIIDYVSNDFNIRSILTESASYFFSCVLLVIILTGAWYVNDYIKQQKKMEEIEKTQAQAELQFLKTQISPHFLFNTLNNIYGLAGKKSDLTQDVVLKLSDILRYLLYESNIPLVAFEREIQVIHAYTELEVLQLSDKEHLRFEIDADGPYHIPPLLWLPILENLFKYGTRLIGNEPVEFGCTIRQGVLTIRSRNPCKPQPSHRVGGIGLENLRKRLSLLYPGRHTMLIENQEPHFVTEVQVQLS